MVDPKEERKFRTLMRRISVECYTREDDPPELLLEWAAWLEDPAGIGRTGLEDYLDMLQRYIDGSVFREDGLTVRLQGDSVAEAFSRIGGAEGRRKADRLLNESAFREREFEARWPELYAYCRKFDTMPNRDVRRLEEAAADRFTTALLGCNVIPRDAGSLIAFDLCKWAYMAGAFDKAYAMFKRGRLFSDELPAFVTMADKPDYETRGEWTEKHVEDMNDWIVYVLALESAEDALAGVYEGERPEERGVPDLGSFVSSRGVGERGIGGIRVSRIVSAARDIQQEGMRNGIRLLKESLAAKRDPHEFVIGRLRADWGEYFAGGDDTDPPSSALRSEAGEV